ncbi:MAG: ATP-binding cassette domain-containing protein [Acidimicrobiales bacterium]
MLDDLDLEVRHGELVAVMGRNGSGKSTLLALIAGLRAPNAGRLEVAGLVPSAVAPRELVRQVGLVPSDPGLLLYRDTVRAECAAADGDTGLAPGTTAALAERLVPGLDPQRHPRDLSEGQRLGLALAVVLAAGPPVLLLDEPTRGLDYDAKRHLAGVLDDLVRAGHAVVVVSHDVEFVARVADRAVVLADSHVVADGPARDVVCHSPVLAPQVAKVLAPAPWMTVDEVAAALQLRGVS